MHRFGKRVVLLLSLHGFIRAAESYLMGMFTYASLCLSQQKYTVQIQSEMTFTAPCKAGVHHTKRNTVALSY